MSWKICSDDEVDLIVRMYRGEIVSAAADAYVDAWWSASGALLFGACGALTLHTWHEVPRSPRREQAQAAAVCALAAAALFVIDSLMAICSAHKEGSSMRTKSLKCNPCS